MDNLDIEKIKEAYNALKHSDHYVRTPVLFHVQKKYGISDDLDLYLKLENLQVMGSFKIRGVFNQMRHLPEGAGTTDKMLLAMSAGNYGKAFAYLTHQMSLKAKVLMPDTAPDNREETIKKYGALVERMPTSELLPRVEEYSNKHNMVHLHSYDDPILIQGHGSLGLEILEDIPDPDIVVICCGGGGLLSGTAAAIKLSASKKCRIYGVEPHGSRTMYESYKAGKAVAMKTTSIASGLSPPSAGTNAYKLCRQYVDDILLVTDEEIMTAMMVLYDRGHKVEASGAAAFAALYSNKVPDTKGKKVVVVVTGSNVTIDELSSIQQSLRQTTPAQS